MSGNEPIEIRRGDPIGSVAGSVLIAAGVTGLYLIASGDFGLFPDFWRRTFGAVVLGLFAVLLAGLVYIGLRLLLRHVVRIDFSQRRITSSVGLPFLWLRTKILPASHFDSVALRCGRVRGPFISGFDCRISLEGRNQHMLLRAGIDRYDTALAEARQIADRLGLRLDERRESTA